MDKTFRQYTLQFFAIIVAALLAYCVQGLLNLSEVSFFGGINRFFLWIYTSVFLVLFIILDRITNSHAVRLVSIGFMCYPFYYAYKWIFLRQHITDVIPSYKSAMYAPESYYRLVSVLLILLIIYLITALIVTFKKKQIYKYKRSKIHAK